MADKFIQFTKDDTQNYPSEEYNFLLKCLDTQLFKITNQK